MKRVDLQLNTNCNQQCLFCSNSEIPDYFLSTAAAKKEIKKAIDDGAEIIAFNGGEPTLRNDLPALVDYIKKLKGKTNVILLTNGMRLSDERYAARLKKINIISVSLHGARATTNDKLTKIKGSFQKSLTGAKIVRDLGYNLLVFYYVITAVNYREAPDFVKLIIENFPEDRIRGITFAYPYISGRMKSHLDLQPKFSKFIPFLLKARNLCRDNNIDFNIASCGLMPLCAVGDLRDQILKNNRRYNEKTIKTATKFGDGKYILSTNEFQKENFVRSPQCQKCAYQKLCPGVWKAYAEIYGTGELRAIKR